MVAICIQCGVEKTTLYEKCRKCAFEPRKTQENLIKSVYLSSARFDSEVDKKEYELELRSYAERIRKRLPIAFDPVEVERLRIQHAETDGFNEKSTVRYLFKVFLPGLILLLELICVVIALNQL